MNLKIKDRIAIIQMLPQSGSLSEMVDIMEIVKKSRLTAQEKLDVDFKETANSAMWNIAKDLGVDVNFTLDELSVLKAAVKKLDLEKGITANNLEICLQINSL